mmetsp:Transcript_29895/g.82077  ORF Transcript_29895/g.82077 Transcript_29895/m.82077 type:complete len:499 (-) Transcript_29895:275-1771(-)|eukprot:CAMPEP_0117504748 /NCGR_PEP_ID=MMETSP0784-20121206/25010_1 /TAXON_ID=39447 /ORGANISM="" /LENGTH=498 /DNA_ID=CAMNT_0005300115 /DNA_START=53 /DNA_END=1549 /DNA_ORIENTATION=+
MGSSQSTKEKQAATGAETAPCCGRASVSADMAVKAFDAKAFILDNKGKIGEFYEVDRVKLGEGSYGAVCKAKNKATGCTRAVKTINKAKMKNLARFKTEIDLMKRMDHPNILKLYETFEDTKNIYLIMELCVGGELFDRIIDAGRFTEKQAALVMQQIIRGIHYMHSIHVCHRDLKPENFLFETKDAIEDTGLKIIDFGLSCEFKPGQYMKTKAGTPFYVAPEVLAGKYDEKSDTWGIGVIMYVLLCGYPPFYGENDASILQAVRKGNYSFAAEDWSDVSGDAKALINNLLVLSAAKRFTAEQALHDKWLDSKVPKKDVPLKSGVIESLRRFRSQNKLKKAAIHIIASNLKEKEIKAMRDIFLSLDKNGDGKLTLSELSKGIKESEISEIPSDLQQILEQVDSDGSGEIDYTEFVAAACDKRVYLQEDYCWAAFRVFDRNGDGKISQDELKAVLGDEDVNAICGASAVSQLLQQIDENGDGMIDFDEFMAMMRTGNGL